MSNVALFNPAQLPAFARTGELSDIAKALAGGGAGGGKRISIKGGVFRLMSAGKEVAAIDERFLDVVIVKAAPKVSRIFYAAKYDGETAAQPDCWSPDGDKPDAKSANKQSATCESCPQNIAGSGNGQSRACRYQQRLAVVLANDIEGDVMQLALPATSIFGKEEGENRPLQAYARWLVAQSVDPSMVVTRMKFDTKAEAPKIHFKAMRWLTDDEFTEAGEQGKTDDALKAVTMSVGATDGAKPADAMQGDKPKAKAAPAPEADEDDEAPAPAPKAAKKAKAAPVPAAEDEDEAEPEVRKAEKKPSAVPGKKSLADVVGGWDDED